jgi:hypothetical protein
MRNHDLGSHSHFSPALLLVPLSRRLPQQHKSPKVLVAALAMPEKASHIQIIGDSSC